MTDEDFKSVSEVVLPSGRFAQCRLPLVLDMLTANASEMEPMFVYVHRCVRLDGKHMTKDELMELPISEYLPMANMLGNLLNKANKTGLGVK